MQLHITLVEIEAFCRLQHSEVHSFVLFNFVVTNIAAKQNMHTLCKYVQD